MHADASCGRLCPIQLVIEALQAPPRLEIMHEQSNLQGRGRSETGRQQSICCCRASGKTLFILCLMYATFTEGIGEKVATVATESLSIVHGIPHIY